MTRDLSKDGVAWRGAPPSVRGKAPGRTDRRRGRLSGGRSRKHRKRGGCGPRLPRVRGLGRRPGAAPRRCPPWLPSLPHEVSAATRLTPRPTAATEKDRVYFVTIQGR